MGVKPLRFVYSHQRILKIIYSNFCYFFWKSQLNYQFEKIYFGKNNRNMCETPGKMLMSNIVVIRGGGQIYELS